MESTHKNVIIDVIIKNNKDEKLQEYFEMFHNRYVIEINTEKINSALDFELLGGQIYDKLPKSHEEFYIDLKSFEEDEVPYILNGMLLKSWVYDEFKQIQYVKSLTLFNENYEKIKNKFQELSRVSYGNMLTRYLVELPPNFLNPQTFPNYIKEFLKDTDIEITILNKKQLEELQCNLIVAVSKGSQYPPHMIILKKGKNPTKAIIGKGVTFDTGGMNLKPDTGMLDMLHDMSGAAAVIGALYATDEEVYGILPIVENMIDANAYNMREVYKSMSGHWVEILHTDAEGRLILADAVFYAYKILKVKTIITIATLTGAVGVALGNEYAALMTNSCSLKKKLFLAGERSGEKIWQLPMCEAYNNGIENPKYDIGNVSLNKSVKAGTILGGKFIYYFIDIKNMKNKTNEDYQVEFAHIDIAYAIDKKSTLFNNNYKNGFGVRLLSDYLKLSSSCCSNTCKSCE